MIRQQSHFTKILFVVILFKRNKNTDAQTQEKTSAANISYRVYIYRLTSLMQEQQLTKWLRVSKATVFAEEIKM